MPGGLEEGDARFNHVARAVQLMTFCKVSPAFRRGFDREVGVQVAIFALGGRHQFNHLVSGFFQFGVRLLT